MLHLQGQPTHPLIPTRKFVRLNKKYAPDYIASTNLYKQYPFKYTEAGRRSAIVQSSELTDYKFSLTQGEWTEIIASYTRHVADQMLDGYQFKFPKWRMGSIEFRKMPFAPIDFNLYKQHGVLARHQNISADYHGVSIHWMGRKFKFQSIWGVRLGVGRYLYDRIINEPNLIHNLNEK